MTSTVHLLPKSGHPLAVPCTVYPPLKTDGRKPELVIHLYGHSGSHTYYNLQQPAYASLLERLRAAGFLVIVPELGPSHWMNTRSVAILDALIAGIPEVDPRKIHLLGTSMGGGSALIYARQRPHTVSSVCAVFPMTDFQAWTAEQPQYLPLIAQAHGIDIADPGAALHALSPLRHIADFAPIPIWLLHGDADPTVPAHHSRDFAAALRARGCPVTYHEVPGGIHEDGLASRWQEDIFTFIEGSGRRTDPQAHQSFSSRPRQ